MDRSLCKTNQRADEIARLYGQYGGALLLFASAIGGDQARAQDALQQVFVKLLENESIGTVSNERAFLFACVRNAILNDAKARGRDAPFETNQVWFDPPQRDYAAEKNLRLALQSLPDDQREVIVLHLWGELTFSEIGELLGTSANTAASRYLYALTNLRHSMLHKEGSRAQLRR